MNKQHKSKNFGTIAVALSGGIDSATTAYLLQKSGFEIFSVTMKFFDNELFKKNMQSVDKICKKLKIKNYALDLTKNFKEKIIEPFCTIYLAGQTPNPCVECNKFIKFGILLEKIKNLGASHLATGHYARIEKSEGKNFYKLKKGLDINKDQSYFLWKLNQEQLSQVILPLGSILKSQVTQAALQVFSFLKDRRESQEICFINGLSYHDFLIKTLKIGKNKTSGIIMDTAGRILGTHKGYPFYTIGQRKGLGISRSKPIYVKDIIPEKNIIIVCEEDELSKKQFYVHDLNFISGKPPALSFSTNVKIRYNSDEQPAKIQILKDHTALIKFRVAQKAITPGQSAVFYLNDILLGGGIITKN